MDQQELRCQKHPKKSTFAAFWQLCPKHITCISHLACAAHFQDSTMSRGFKNKVLHSNEMCSQIVSQHIKRVKDPREITRLSLNHIGAHNAHISPFRQHRRGESYTFSCSWAGGALIPGGCCGKISRVNLGKHQRKIVVEMCSLLSSLPLSTNETHWLVQSSTILVCLRTNSTVKYWPSQFFQKKRIKAFVPLFNRMT